MTDTVPSAHSGITIDMIISRFIPVAGALLMISGLGYLLYDSVWVNLDQPIKIGLGFFLSLIIIAGGFSFSDRLRYFADVVIGAGVLLLYGTLIAGSRTVGDTHAVMSEVPAIIAAALFTIAIVVLARERKSVVIVILGLLGAYLTPFVIGTSGSWAYLLDMNAYLTYFLFVNLSIFFIGRDISVRHIIPVNSIGLLLSSSLLYGLMVHEVVGSSEIFTAFLFVAIALTSVVSIVTSSRTFLDQDELYLALGYILPLFWMVLSLDQLHLDHMMLVQVIIYAILSATYFALWYYLRSISTRRYQHIALYIGAVFSLCLALSSLSEAETVIKALFFPYIGLIFAALYVLAPEKRGERFLTYWFMSGFGAMLVLDRVYFSPEGNNSGFIAAFGLIPAILGYFIAVRGGQKSLLPSVRLYSLLAGVMAVIFILGEVLQRIDPAVALFLAPALFTLLFLRFGGVDTEHQKKILPLALIWATVGFAPAFLQLLDHIYPAPAGVFWMDLSLFRDGDFLQGVLMGIIYFLGLSMSRSIQRQTHTDRPAFLLVILGYTTILVVVNYAILALMNDIVGEPNGVHGSARAIVTTLWWVVLSLYMLIMGIRLGHGHRSEKLLGLLLLTLTVMKIVVYDMDTMATNNKIVVLMIVGGALMGFSYLIHQKGWLKEEEKLPSTPDTQS